MASTRQQYLRKLERLISQAQRLDDRTLRGMLQTLEQARQEVALSIADAPTDWTMDHFQRLEARIVETMRRVNQQLQAEMAATANEKWDKGTIDVDRFLSQFGDEESFVPGSLDLTELGLLKGFSADMIQQVPQSTIDKVSTAIKTGILGGKSPHEVIQDIGTALVDEHGNPAPNIWGDTAKRAEVVYRTEANRVYTAATQARQLDHNKRRPGLKKVWMHSGKLPGRASHRAAERRYGPAGEPGPIPVDEPFILVVKASEATRRRAPGEYEAMYPRDPRLPPELSILCGCTQAPWRDEWEELEGVA